MGKRNIKQSRKIFIAVVAIVLVLAVTVGIIYWRYPDVFWQGVEFFNSLFGLGDKGSHLVLHDGELQVHFIDVGQGDCILILFTDGKTMMIDAGSRYNSSVTLNNMLTYIEPLLLGGVIDYMMLTHGDEDHCCYLDEVLDIYQVNKIFMPNIKAKVPSSEIEQEKLDLFTDEDTLSTVVYTAFFNAALLEEGAEIVLNIGVQIIETEHYRLTFYCPSEEYWENNHLKDSDERNAISPIGILEYNNTRVVFTGDSTKTNEEIFVQNTAKVDCDVLKVAHHGSDSSSTDEFLDFITCEYAVISVGANNTYGHPHQATLDRFSQRNITVYRTDQDGSVVLSITDVLVISSNQEDDS